MGTKDERIQAEQERLLSLFDEVDENQIELVEGLIKESAFMRVTLDDLQEIIKTEGVVDTYQNGATQSGKKQSATLQSYNALIKNYNTVIKTLINLLPKEPTASTEKGDKLLQFLQAHSK